MTASETPQTNPSNCFFAGSHAALHTISHALQGAQVVRIATAYFEGSRFQALQDVLQGKQLRLLVGRREGGEDALRAVLDEFVRELSTGPMEQRTRAMRQMLEALEQGRMTAAVGGDLPGDLPELDARYLYHHAKLYLADRRAAVVTSANCSHHGLCLSREAGIIVSDPDDVVYFVERFDHYFNRARSITDALIAALQAWLAAYDPYWIYARVLLELYGLPVEEVPAQLPPLARYQEGAVTSVVRSLMENNGAYLIASTGLGKTVMAAHAAAYLRLQGEIDSALVVCPAGLREVWRRQLRAARVTSVEFSYHTLTRLDGDSSLPMLEYELRNVTRSTLIILDESHRLRNEQAKGGDLRLSNERIRQAVRARGAKVLLQTATPYGKDFKEVESQLNLLPAPKEGVITPLAFRTEADIWRAEGLADLPELPVCTVLTTPDVVRHFGQQDQDGERYVLFSEEDRRYFPRRMRLQTVRYQNPFDDFLADLLESGLLHKHQGPDERPGQSALLLDGLEESEGKRLPLQEALFLHQFCSSPAQVGEVCRKLESGGYEYSFARQQELTAFIRARHSLIQRAQNPRQDSKLNALAGIVRAVGTDKVVVFCEYLETAQAVRDGLRILLPGTSVETTVDVGNLDGLIQRFAPIANEVLEEERDPEQEVQVLIATRSVSEGFNLQDASVLVNYDLPWTVLQLAQRMGRILRPWRTPRDVMIYNFVPSTMAHTRVRHERLQERGRQYRSLANIPVLVPNRGQDHQEDKAFQMEELGQDLYQAGEDPTDLNLDQVLEFIQSVDDLTTSAFYNDLARIDDRERIKAFPAGIRSAKQGTGPKRLFLLLRHGRKVDTVLADAQGRPLEESWRAEAVLRAIRCMPDTSRAPFEVYPGEDAFDAWIERTRACWAEEIGIAPYRLQVMCALALV